jgi:hypothetical protein
MPDAWDSVPMTQPKEASMSPDVLTAQERLVLIQLRWGPAPSTDSDDEKICRRLEAQGLITKIARGGWEITTLGKGFVLTPG